MGFCVCLWSSRFYESNIHGDELMFFQVGLLQGKVCTSAVLCQPLERMTMLSPYISCFIKQPQAVAQLIVFPALLKHFTVLFYASKIPSNPNSLEAIIQMRVHTNPKPQTDCRPTSFFLFFHAMRMVAIAKCLGRAQAPVETQLPYYREKAFELFANHWLQNHPMKGFPQFLMQPYYHVQGLAAPDSSIAFHWLEVEHSTLLL